MLRSADLRQLPLRPRDGDRRRRDEPRVRGERDRVPEGDADIHAARPGLVSTPDDHQHLLAPRVPVPQQGRDPCPLPVLQGRPQHAHQDIRPRDAVHHLPGRIPQELEPHSLRLSITIKSESAYVEDYFHICYFFFMKYVYNELSTCNSVMQLCNNIDVYILILSYINQSTLPVLILH